MHYSFFFLSSFPAVHTGPNLALVVCVPLILVLLAGFLLLLYKWKARMDTGLNTTGNVDDVNMEVTLFNLIYPSFK